ncbi:MAG: FtsX-like permease family protein [Bacteroidota bacterium]
MITATNLQVAKAHLTSRVKQALVATLSVTFGISMYIFMNGFMTGVNDLQTELAFSTLAHVHIYNDLPEDRSNLLQHHYPTETHKVNLRSPRVIQYTEGIKNAEQVMHKISHFPEITTITPQVNVNVFFRNGAIKVNGQLSGIDVAKEDELFGTSESITAGSWDALAHRGDGIIIGVGLARKLSLSLNDNIMVSTADGVSRSFKIICLIQTSVGSVDDAKAYVRINSARQLISKSRSYATDIQVNVVDFEKADALVAQIDPLTDLKVESWNGANGQLEAGSELRNIIAIAVSLTILLVAGFGIYNIMNMTVNEKIKEIAILKAMGFEGRDIVEIFLTQSVIIGLIGGLVGILFGTVVSISVNNIPFEIATLETLPMAYRTSDYLSAFGFGVLTTFIAGYLPARKASKIDPVDIIRG